MLKYGNFFLSVVTISVAIWSLMQTRRQIELSNKQHLFDKRVENYLIAMGLIQLYRSNGSLFNHEKDEPIVDIDFEFELLTNNTYLEQITPVIKNPLKEPSHKELLIKLENLKEVSTKIKFLFSSKASVLLGDFVLRYQELLFAMYQYRILLDRMKKVSQDFKLTLEKSQQTVGEEKHRVKLKEAFDNLKQAEIMLIKQKVEEQIKKEIKLY